MRPTECVGHGARVGQNRGADEQLCFGGRGGRGQRIGRGHGDPMAEHFVLRFGKIEYDEG